MTPAGGDDDDQQDQEHQDPYSLGVWVPCPNCEEFICTRHGGHASECPCPPIEEWP